MIFTSSLLTKWSVCIGPLCTAHLWQFDPWWLPDVVFVCLQCRGRRTCWGKPRQTYRWVHELSHVLPWKHHELLIRAGENNSGVDEVISWTSRGKTIRSDQWKFHPHVFPAVSLSCWVSSGERAQDFLLSPCISLHSSFFCLFFLVFLTPLAWWRYRPLALLCSLQWTDNNMLLLYFWWNQNACS